MSLLSRVEALIPHAVIIFAAVSSILVIRHRAYTEIDWTAYMQEVGGYLGGETNYMRLRGDTGPLVYPAFFVYVYSLLHRLTQGGVDVLLAQYIFAGLYVTTVAILVKLYTRSGRVPAAACLFLVLSPRILSIFVLRLFNDCFSAALAYAATLSVSGGRTALSSVLLSLAVGMKMSSLLFLPGMGIIWWLIGGIPGALRNVFLFVTVQVLLSVPFTMTYPAQYMARAFEFSRVFNAKWSMNFAYLSRESFYNPLLSQGLLAASAACVGLFVAMRWVPAAAWRHLVAIPPRLSSPIRAGAVRWRDCDPVLIAFASNLIGIVFCRSMHVQFYVWYAGTVPYLLFAGWPAGGVPWFARVALIVLLEASWNVYPATPASSGAMTAIHALLLIGVWWGAREWNSDASETARGGSGTATPSSPAPTARPAAAASPSAGKKKKKKSD